MGNLVEVYGILCFCPLFRYTGNGITINPITVDDLAILSSLQQIQGFLAIHSISSSVNLTSLSFLSNLESVLGFDDSYRNYYGVYISHNPALQSLQLASLQTVRYGNVAIQNNSALCSTAVWSPIVLSPYSGVSPVSISGNRLRAACCKF